MSFNFDLYRASCQARINTALDTLLPLADSEFASTPARSQRLFDAMRYSLLNGGKRVRPLLVYASADALGGADARALDLAACALECIHAYSLVHDDLPAMDDDDLRRGQPTCHRAYDEATAILAGDGLQALAFELLLAAPLAPEPLLAMARDLATAAGPRGMVGGQAIDVAAQGTHPDLNALAAMHQLKTGALIRAAVRLGARAANATPAQLAALDDYARCIGLAFQVQDDILDVESDTATLGKQSGADAALDKPTYPALLGLDGAKQKARQLLDDALQALDGFDQRADALRALARFVVQRHQ